MARLAGMLSPFVAYPLAEKDVRYSLTVYATFAIAAAFAAIALPIETLGRAMTDTVRPDMSGDVREVCRDRVGRSAWEW